MPRRKLTRDQLQNTSFHRTKALLRKAEKQTSRATGEADQEVEKPFNAVPRANATDATGDGPNIGEHSSPVAAVNAKDTTDNASNVEELLVHGGSCVGDMTCSGVAR